MRSERCKVKRRGVQRPSNQQPLRRCLETGIPSILSVPTSAGTYTSVRARWTARRGLQACSSWQSRPSSHALKSRRRVTPLPCASTGSGEASVSVLFRYAPNFRLGGGRGVVIRSVALWNFSLDTDNQWVNVANPVIVGEEQDAPVAAANQDFSHLDAVYCLSP